MFGELAAFQPATRKPTALFLDTSGLFAYFHPGVAEHDRVSSFVEAVGANEMPYRPLYTSTYVLDELVTLLRRTGGHDYAVDALTRTLDSESVTVLTESEAVIERTRDRIEAAPSSDLTFTDHVSVVQMAERNVTHVLTFDERFDDLDHDFERIPRR